MKLTTKTILKVLFIFIYGINTGYSQMPNYPMKAENAALNYTDLENFAFAFSKMDKESDTIKLLQEHYFNKASMGLKEYITRHGLTPVMLKKSIEKYPKVYAKIPQFIENLPALKGKLTTVLKKFGTIVPKTMYAPTYLLVGANRGIAQASKYGQLVTIGRVLKNEKTLLKMIVHELSHFQQVKTLGGPKYVGLYSKPNNMLELCLREGGAEFITKQVLNGITQEKSLLYFNKNEKKLKLQFLKDLKKQDNSFWLWGSVGNKKNPQLLGYVMGYKIWEHYYSISDKKEDVIVEILGLVDAEQYIKKSGYFAN